MNENNEKSKHWKYCSFTKAGAISLAKIMRDKFNVEIINEPYKTNDDMWEFKFENPFWKDKHDI